MFKRLASASVMGFVFLACTGDSGSSDPSGADLLDPGGATPSSRTPMPSAAPVPIGRVASMSSAQNVPSFVWANRGAGTPALPAPGTSIETAARQHLQQFATLYGIDAKQTAALELRHVHDTGRGAIIARFLRRVSGIEVFGEQVSVAMDRNLGPVALTGSVSGGLPLVLKASARAAATGFALDVAQAVRVTLQDLTLVAPDPSELDAPVGADGGYQTVSFERARLRIGATGVDPARVKRVFYPASAGVRPDLLPAYYVETDVGRGSDREPRFFAYVISATDGAILWKRDLTAHEAFTYRVYADDNGLFMPWDGPQGTTPTPNPNGTNDQYQAALLQANLVTLSSLQSVGVEDPWLAPGSTSTRGNNVDAYLDITTPDGFTPGADFRGAVSAPGVFDYSLDLTANADASLAQRQSAITQLFFNLNWFHDWYYAAGFTEATGNAQFANFGRGGVEGDAIRAEGQDFGGQNNANMSTPADGGRPRMQMYLWKFGTASLTTSSAQSAAGRYQTRAASFSPLNFELTGELVRADPPEACSELVGDYTGKIVLIDRGTCERGFLQKSENAQAAGAIGAIIANVATSPNPNVVPTPGATAIQPITIGVLTLNLADGDELRESLSAGDEVEATLTANALLRDGDVDNQIVAHEWGHYISNRMIFDAAGLGTNMSGGLGEGWADFHALLITVRPEDITNPTNTRWNGVYSMGGYATGSVTSSPYYFGVRRYPYSTDLSKNPLTFKHISNEGSLPEDVPRAFEGDHAEVHNIGEVWATMLWECYAALLRDTLGATRRLSFAEARDRMRDYIVAAYQLTPANPTLLEARDALLAAALAGDSTDYARFAAAFARRGAGVVAVGPSRFDDTNSGIVESFEVGAALLATSMTLTDDVTPVCIPDGVLDGGETGTLRVVFENHGNTPIEAITASASSNTPGVTFPDGASISVPPVPIQGTAVGSLRVHVQGLSGITPLDFSVQLPDIGTGTPPASAAAFLGNLDQWPDQSSSDGAESSHVAWQVLRSDPSIADTAVWQRERLSPDEHVYHCATASTAGSVDLVSPPLRVLAGTPFTLSFRHRFDFESDGANTNFDGGVIELSSDGGASWNDVGSDVANYTGVLTADSGNPLGGRSAFVQQSADYPNYAATLLDLGDTHAGEQVLIRFRVVSDAGTTSPGWDVDDLTFTGIANTPFDAVVPQPQRCNNAPIATLGLNQSLPESGLAPGFEPTLVTLDGSASFDPEGDPLTYHWTQVSGSPVKLTALDAAFPSFTAPNIASASGLETLSFQLVVDDGLRSSSAKLTNVVLLNVNRPPSASAGAGQGVAERSVVRLDGTGSTDPDGTPLSFSWVAPAGITLSNAASARPEFLAPDVDADTSFSFELSVSDGETASPTSTVVVSVRNLDPVPPPPIPGPDAGALP